MSLCSNFQPMGKGKYVFDIGCEQHGEYIPIEQVSGYLIHIIGTRIYNVDHYIQCIYYSYCVLDPTEHFKLWSFNAQKNPVCIYSCEVDLLVQESFIAFNLVH